MSDSYHFIGVGGIGMSAIARLLLAHGETVSGSDAKVSPLLDQLRDLGARIAIGHDAANLDGADTVVISSAIERHNPELAAARRRGMPILHRGEMLARLLSGRRGIAVCGTHGKTTTTAMAHAVLRAGGIDASLALGGIDATLNTNAYDGSSEWFVTEADESDGSFALLKPAMAVVTNLENDHLESDDDLPKLAAAFSEFLAKLPSGAAAIVGADNALSASLVVGSRAAKTISFGLSSDAAVRAANVRFGDLRSHFDAIAGDVCLGTVELAVPGAMNVQNALAAIAVGRELEIPFAQIARGLRAFRGVRRRFDVLVKNRRMTVVDDYAHHPTAVGATIAAARRYYDGPLIVAFQPHRFTRTAFLAGAFADALNGADVVYLTPVYAASEAAIPGVTERSIGEPLSAFGTPVRYADCDALPERVLQEAPDGALVLVLGAGDVSEAAAELARRVAATAVDA